MKKLTMLTFIITAFCITAFAQDPANFHLIYGNRDGNPMPVRIGTIIEVPMWGATDPAPANPDTVAFMHNPLATRNLYIIERLDGYVNDECSYMFLPSEYGWPYTGYTNQSFIRFSYYPDPVDPNCMFWTGGDTVLIGYFRMRTTNDSSLIGQTICPFTEGYSPQNGGCLWGMNDGVRGVAPVQTYGCLRFYACDYASGDINDDGIFNGQDLIYLTNFFKGGEAPPVHCECSQRGWAYPAIDMNGNCIFNGIDVIYGVNYLKGTGPAPGHCLDCD